MGDTSRPLTSSLESLAIAAIDALPQASVMVFDLELRYLIVRGGALRDQGVVPEQLEGRLVLDAIGPDRFAFYEPLYRDALAGRTNLREVPSLRGGQTFLIQVGPLFDHDGNVMGGVSMAVDISDQKRLEAESAFLAAVVRDSDEAIISATVDGTIVSWNRGAERLYGYEPAEIIGRSASVLAPQSAAEEIPEVIRRVIGGERVLLSETVRRRKDGSLIDVAATVSPIFDPQDQVIGISTVAHDITERRRYESQLRDLAEHDPLTGVHNRRAFDGAVREQLARARRYGETATIVSVDLDDFKSINDQHGHGIGDSVLQACADTLRRRVRECDMVARVGGDEFALLLQHADAVTAESVVRDLRARIEEISVWTSGCQVAVRASFGVAVIDGSIDDEEVRRRADEAMYVEKAHHHAQR